MTPRTDSSSLPMRVFASYIHLWAQLKWYRTCYGGFRAVLKSPYFHFSIFLLAVTHGEWNIAFDREKGIGWCSVVLGVMPNMVGFTLGGYAILLSFGDDKYRALISGTTTEPSPYMQISATFLHFIIMQISALLFAVLANSICGATAQYRFGSLLCKIVSGFGFWLFLYSICLAVASTFAVFTVSRSFDKSKREQKNHERRLQMIKDDLAAENDAQSSSIDHN